MGDEQRLPSTSSSCAARERVRRGTDFTVAVEEEFALLDPGTLGLVNRFEDVQAAAQGTALEPHLVGELIASEAEVRRAAARRSPRPPATMAERRAQLHGARRAARDRARRDRHAPVEPLAGPADHRHAALPPQRRAPPLRRLAQQHVRPARARRHPRRRPRDRRPQRRCATSCRSCSRSRRARRSSRASTAGCTPPGRRSSRGCSRAAASPTRRRLGRVRGLRPLPLRDAARSTSTRSSGGASARISPSRRSRSGSATRSPTSPRRARSPRSPTRSRRGIARAHRRGRAAARPAAPADRGEPLARDPLRAVRRADRPRRAASPSRRAPARAADRVGAARRGRDRRGAVLAVPERNAAERQIARLERGRDAWRRSTRSRWPPGSGCAWLREQDALREEVAARSAGRRPARADARLGRLARLSRSSSPATPATPSRRGSRSRRSARSSPVLEGQRRRGAPARLLRGRARSSLQPAYARGGRTRSAPAEDAAQAEIGVFGGSGFYSFLDDVEEVEVETPYGTPSAPLPSIGEIGGKRVAFLPRHGREHELPPHGSRTARTSGRCGSSACAGSSARTPRARCRPSSSSGEFVVCDQFVDRTSGRADTFYDGPETTHVSAADPYCADLRRVLVETARELGIPVRDGGTVVVDPGPALLDPRRVALVPGTGWDVINMTAYPEGHLARELELCYAEHLDGHRLRRRRRGRRPVSTRTVLRVFNENIERLRALLLAAIPRIGPQPADACSTALAMRRL